jgi:hypothetical protein
MQLSNSGCPPGRKGRRRFHLPDFPHCKSRCNPTQESSEKKQWPCTFCSLRFRCRWGWKRHEMKHLPPTWFCMLNNYPAIGDLCGLCGEHDPKLSHFRTHFDVDACLNKPLVERGFSRRDKLQGHIRRVHLKQDSPCPFKNQGRRIANLLLDSWHKEEDLSVSKPDALWCGFCQIFLGNWTERVEHVGDHLQSGLKMEKWQGLS